MRLIAERSERRARRRAGVFRHRLSLWRRRSAGRHRAERLRQIDAAAGRRRAAAGWRRAACGSKAAARTWPSVAAACHYLGHLNAMKTGADGAENLPSGGASSATPRLGVDEALDSGRARRHRPSAVRLSLDRPAAPRGDRQAAGQPPAGLAARRADGGAGRGAFGVASICAAASMQRRICAGIEAGIAMRLRGNASCRFGEGRPANAAGGVVRRVCRSTHGRPSARGRAEHGLAPLPPRPAARHPRRRRRADRRAVLPGGDRHDPLRRRAGSQPARPHRPGDPVDRRAACLACSASTGCSRPIARTARSILLMLPTTATCWR